ncbi:MAG: G8 domain-containing protein [Dehalococcoidia bacterium]
MRSGDWSSASTWSTGSVPQPGQNVEISPGHNITFDSNATISRLEVKGTLDFSRSRSTELEVAGNIIVSNGGELLAGTPAEPVPAGITATLRFDVQTGSFAGGHHFRESDTGLWVMSGGRWESHGAPVEHAWARLDRDASSGSSTVIAQGDLRDWPVGSDILVTATGRNIENKQGTTSFFTEDEERKIASVADNGGGTTRITLDSPLSYSHSGSGDARGEVALLSRNVVVTSKGDRRAHTMYMKGAKGSPSYTLFSKLGPKDVMGRYPVHLHTMGDTSIGMKITGNSIWDSENRWVVIHNSLGVEIEENVAYRGLRTGFWLESTDAGSLGPEPAANTFINNLAVKMASLDRSDRRQSAFYADRGNHFIGNVAVSVAGSRENAGFHWPEGGNSSVGHTFIGNETHSSVEHGLFGWQNDGLYHVVDSTMWRNNGSGVLWGAYQNDVQFHNLASFGNEDANFRSRNNHPFIQDSVLYGESSYPTEDGLFIDHYTLPPSPDDPARTYRNVFSNHYGYDINHLSQDTCSLGSRGCTPTFNVIAGTQLNSANPIRFGSDWKTTNTFFDIQDWDGNISGLPESFRLTRSDQSKPSSSAFKNSQMDAWVDPAHPQPSEWPMPPTIQWTSSPSSFGSGSATFTASASGFSTSRGDVEIFVDEFEDGTPWKAEYYDNTNLSGSPLELDLSELNFTYRSGSPAEGLLQDNHWSGRFTKSFVSAGGSHRIELRANDGVRLFLDGTLIFEEWKKLTTCCTSQSSTTLNISAGEHTLVVEYFDDTTDYTILQLDLHRVVSGGSLSKSLTVDSEDWPRKYAHVYARAYDPASGLYAYTPVVRLTNPEHADTIPGSPGSEEPPDDTGDPAVEPNLLVDPTSVETGLVEGESASVAVSADTSDGSTTAVTISSNKSWIVNSSANAPAGIEILVDGTSLQAGIHVAEVTLSAPGYVDSSFSVTVAVSPKVVDDNDPVQVYSLLVSTSGDRSDPVELDGETISGDVHVFISPEDGIDRVTFWINDPSMTGSPFQVENSSPYDMAGGSTSSANPFGTATLVDGAHLITALVAPNTGVATVVTSTFTVDNVLEDEDDPAPGETNPGAYSLSVSSSSDRSNAVQLEGESVSGDIHVFTSSEGGIGRVTFWIDDPAMAGAPFQVENIAPYDMAGGTTSSANGFDTSLLAEGQHSITALIELGDGGSETVSSSFTVVNEAPGPVDPDTSDNYTLSVSVSPNRSGQADLHDRSVSGDIYIFTSPEDDVRKVTFWLDDPSMQGEPFIVEGRVPFDFAGTEGDMTAKPFDTSTLADGSHSVTALVETNGGDAETVTATFVLDNVTEEEDPAQDGTEAYSLFVSSSSDRTSPVALDGSSVSGDVYVFTGPEDDVRSVTFWVNDIDMDGEPFIVEGRVPFDLAGTEGNMTAKPFDAAVLGNGAHSVSALIETRDGTTFTTTATFTVTD